MLPGKAVYTRSFRWSRDGPNNEKTTYLRYGQRLDPLCFFFLVANRIYNFSRPFLFWCCFTNVFILIHWTAVIFPRPLRPNLCHCETYSLCFQDRKSIDRVVTIMLSINYNWNGTLLHSYRAYRMARKTACTWLYACEFVTRYLKNRVVGNEWRILSCFARDQQPHQRQRAGFKVQWCLSDVVTLSHDSPVVAAKKR